MSITSTARPRALAFVPPKHGVIEDDPFWIELTALRNYTVHTYNEQLADHVYAKLPEAARRFRVVLDIAGK